MDILKKKRAWAILFYYLIAVICRYFAIYELPSLSSTVWYSIVGQLLTGIGPILGGVIVVLLFHRKMYCSVFGNSPWRSVACIVLPVILLCLFDRRQGAQASLMLMGCILYAFLEETGWRGYLLGEFQTLPQLKRVLIISLFWFFWHLDLPLGLHGIAFFAILFFASWGLDQLAHDTHSLILCACLHGIFNFFKHSGGVFDTAPIIIILILSIIFWFAVWYVPQHKQTHL